MKHFYCFFMLFLLIFSTFCVASDVKTQNDSQKMLNNFMSNIQKKMIEAENLPAEKVSLIDHPENINFFTLIQMPQKQAGILTGTKGLSPLQDIKDIGLVRLASCYGGVAQKNNTQFLSLEVILNDGVILQKPIFNTTKLINGTNEHILYPVQNVKEKLSTTYQNHLFFPLFYEIIDPEKPFFLSTDITLTGCKNDKCTTKTVPLSLDLKEKGIYQTDLCTAMNRQLRSTPLPHQNKTKISARQINKTDIQLVIHFKRNIDFINLQIDTLAPWHITKKQINDKTVEFILHFPHLSDNKIDALNLKILASAGFFDETVPIKSGAPLHIEQSDSIFTLLKNSVLFFILSPFFLFFLSIKAKSKQELHHQIKQLSILTLISAVIIVIALHFSVLPVYITGFSAFSFVFLAYLCYKPDMTLKLFIPALILMPAPFLNLSSTQIIMASIISLIPFYLLRNQVDFFASMAPAMRQVNNVKRIPIVILLLWALLVLILPTINKTTLLSNTSQIENDIKNNKFALLTLENEPCLSCLMNQFSIMHFNPAKNLYQNGQIKLYSVNINSAIGKKLATELNLNSKSIQLIYGVKNPFGSVISSYLTPIDWSKIFR